jgi:hypothetical protein
MRWCGLDNRIVKRFRALLENVRIRRRKKHTKRFVSQSFLRAAASYPIRFCTASRESRNTIKNHDSH